MSCTACKLVADYARRTLGVWILLLAAQIMQTSMMWAHRVDRVPLIGAIIGSIAFFATFAGQQAVIRTLPLSRRDLALVQWWAGIGLPALVMSASIVLAWWANVGWGFPVPPPAHVLLIALSSLAVVALLSALPLPVLTSSRSNLPRFVVVWGILVFGALYGYPAEWLPLPLMLAGLTLAAAAFGRAQLGWVTTCPPLRTGWSRAAQWRPEQTVRRARLRGWAVLFTQLLRSTLLLSFVAAICATAIRLRIPALESPAFEPVLPIVFISAAGIAGSLIAKRWLKASRALQCLPMRSSSIAAILCLVLMAPGLTACVIATAVHGLVPAWSVAIPVYMLPVFAIVPALLVPWTNVESSRVVAPTIAQWSPFLHLATWPLWTASFASLALTKLMPSWFSTFALLLTAVLALASYFAVRARVRAGHGLSGSEPQFGSRT